MGNLILNKLKTIDNSRLTLKGLLENKGINTGNDDALDSLISRVGELNKYDPHIDEEEFTGVPEEEVPDYYKGDDDWKDLIDLKEILENDTETGYPGKAIFLFRLSDNPELILSSPGDIFRGFSAYRFSDAPTLTQTTQAHTWDSTKDILAEDGSNERFRWIIAYSNISTTSYQSDWNKVQGFNGYKFLPEAVIYYKGKFGRVICQDGYVDQSNSNAYNRYWKAPKYFEVTENCYICAVGEYENLGDYSGTELNLVANQLDYRLRTIILNCSIAKGINCMAAPNLEYFEMNNPNAEYGYYYTSTSTGSSGNYTYYYCVRSAVMRLPVRCEISNIRTYFNLKNHGHIVPFSEANVRKTMNTWNSSYLNDNWSYTNGASSSGAVWHLPHLIDNGFLIANNLEVIMWARYMMNFDALVTDYVRNVAKESGIRYNTHTKFDIHRIIGRIERIGFYSGDIQGTTELDDHNYLKVDIFNNATLVEGAIWKWIMYHTTTVTGTNNNFGYCCFAYSRLKKIDMSEAKVTFNSNVYASQGQDKYDLSWRPSLHPRSYSDGDDLNSYNQTLSGLEYLEEIWLPQNTDMPQYFLCGLPNLEKVVISATWKRIRNYGISYNPKLREIINNSEIMENIGEGAFCRNGKLQSFTLVGPTIQNMGNSVFQNNYEMETASLPENLVTLPAYTFQGCKKLERINLPKNVLTYGASAFAYCSALKSIMQIDNGKPTTVNDYCFLGCSSLETIPDMSALQTLGQYVFKWCRSLIIRPFKAASNHNANAFKCTAAKILIPEGYDMASINVSGANWSIQNFLDFLESLPDRSQEASAYTISLGADINFVKNDDASYSQAFYPLISQFFVVEDQEGHLTFVDSIDVPGAQAITAYVGAKNWILN